MSPSHPPLSDYCLKESTLPVLVVHRDMSTGGPLQGEEAALPSAITPVSYKSEEWWSD